MLEAHKLLYTFSVNYVKKGGGERVYSVVFLIVF